MNLSLDETRTHRALESSIGGRLIKLFENQHISRAAKLDCAYKIVREAAPADCRGYEFALHARILISAAENAIIRAADVEQDDAPGVDDSEQARRLYNAACDFAREIKI